MGPYEKDRAYIFILIRPDDAQTKKKRRVFITAHHIYWKSARYRPSVYKINIHVSIKNRIKSYESLPRC